MTSRRFLFVLGSSRSEGNTELLARRAAEQLPSDVEQQWLSLAEHPLPDFLDLRHDSEYLNSPTGDTPARLLDATLAATDIVIASPVYWYSVSALTKRYLDYWSGWLRTPASTSRHSWPGAPCGACPCSRTTSPWSPTRSSAR